MNASRVEVERSCINKIGRVTPFAFSLYLCEGAEVSISFETYHTQNEQVTICSTPQLRLRMQDARYRIEKSRMNITCEEG
jgi:hypothetical protein